MTRINNIIEPSTVSASIAANSLNDIDLNDIDLNGFLKLILTELQNQDPLNPTDNAALLQQVAELRGISSNDQLVSNLKGFSNTQELSSASSLIGETIKGLDVGAKEVIGEVTSVSVKIDEKDRNKR